MNTNKHAWRWLTVWPLIVVTLAFLAASPHVRAQGGAKVQDDFGEPSQLFNNFSLGKFDPDQKAEEPVEWSARYFADPDGRGRLEVEASLADKWHIYSTTQKPGGPTRTRITVIGPEEAEPTDVFTPDYPPATSISSVYDGLSVEEHEGVVVWSAPLDLPEKFEEPIEVSVRALVCKSGGDNRCMPVEETLQATYSGLVESAEKVVAQVDSNDAAEIVTESAGEPFRDGDYVVQWTAAVKDAKVAPGQTTVLQFTAKPDPTFHVYKSVVDDSESSTNFVLTDKAGLKVGEPVANKPFVTKTILPSLPPVSYYKGQVTWQLPVEVPEGTSAGEKKLEGLIAYQACTDTSCHRPVALKFDATITVGDDETQTPEAIELASAKSVDALDAAATTDWVDSDVKLSSSGQPDPAQLGQTDSEGDDEDPVVATTGGVGSFLTLLGLSFIGGLILNVMPCVLPVVGLKVMGFVSQAGENRTRILTLNLVYVLGIMAVFAVLAIVAAVSKFGWGEQFTYFPVRLGLTLLLFALALSYLGVWEIPVPGMAAGKASQELQAREGHLGAFSKGIFATILATPCSGPLLGYILGLTLNFTPAQTILIFLTVGLGMSSPYILIGFQPKLVTWLPKPGAWMETLKQLMAFLFLGTVAFFFAQFKEEQKLPVFVSLIAVWLGCWIIGQVPSWSQLRKRLMAWAGGIAVATAISIWAFVYLVPNSKLQWIDYSERQLQQLTGSGRTVLVDFGAKWCASCIYNYEVAIDTDETREVVEELDAVAMYADYTDYDDDIKMKLEELETRSLPLLAIYPGGRPNEPILLRDVVTQQQVIEALRAAGASVDPSTASSATNEVRRVASTK